jgi:hypothetical protein
MSNPKVDPDPLAPGRIPGQNPNTPERMPGHTRFYSRRLPGGGTMPDVRGGVFYAGLVVMLLLVIAMLAIWVLPAAT